MEVNFLYFYLLVEIVNLLIIIIIPYDSEECVCTWYLLTAYHQ